MIDSELKVQLVGDRHRGRCYIGTGYRRIAIEFYDRTLLYVTTQHGMALAWDFYMENDIIGWRSRGVIWA